MRIVFGCFFGKCFKRHIPGLFMPIKIISKQEYENQSEKLDQEKTWDSIANPWQDYRKKSVPIVEEFLKNKSGLVVDLGCGSGRNMIKNQNISYFGLDFSEMQLKHAEKYIKENEINARLFKSRIDNLDKNLFKDNMFDYGLFIATLHCLETEEQRKNALMEFFRILKPGAGALISVWNSEDKRFDIVKNHGDIYMSWEKDRIPYMRYYYLFSKDEFIDLIQSAGFKILEFYSPKEQGKFSKKNWILRIKKP